MASNPHHLSCALCGRIPDELTRDHIWPQGNGAVGSAGLRLRRAVRGRPAVVPRDHADRLVEAADGPQHVERGFEAFDVVDNATGSVLFESSVAAHSGWERGPVHEEALAWLSENYPDHDDPAAYWPKSGDGDMDYEGKP